MKILQEISEWDLDFVPNHEYHLNDKGMLVAYRYLCKGPLITFSKPLRFVKSYRKFKEIKS